MGDEPITVDTPLLCFQSTRGNKCILDGKIYELSVTINIFDPSKLNCPVHVLICGPRDVKMRDQTLRAFSDRVVRQVTGINDLMYNANVLVNISCDEQNNGVQKGVHFMCTATIRPKEIQIPSIIRKIDMTTDHSNHIPGISLTTEDQRRCALLGQFERSVYLFVKLGGYGPEGKHVPRRVDYLQMSSEVMREKLQSFENTHLFPLLDKGLHTSGEDADTFLRFLQRDIKLDIGDCLERFRSVFRRTRAIGPDCTSRIISVKCALRKAEHCKFHWFLIFKQRDTEISGSPTKTGIKWDEDGDRDPTHDITYPVKTDPGLQKMKDCALQYQPLGNTTEHWLCPCAWWLSTVIGEYSRMGYIEGISSSGTSVENLHLQLVYSPLGI